MNIETHIAQFLKENNYPETLKAFEREYGKPFSDSPNEPLQTIIEDRYNYKALNAQAKDLELTTPLNKELNAILNNQVDEWAVPYPKVPKLVTDSIDGLVISSCLVFNENTPILFLGTSKTKLYVINLLSNEILQESTGFIGKCVIKNITIVSDNKLVLLGMNGKLHLCEYSYGETFEIKSIDELQAHPRLIVDTKSIQFNNDTYVVTLGWDFTLKVFTVQDRLTPVTQYKLPTQGTSFDVTVFADKVTLVVGLNETTLLSVFHLIENDLVLLYKISLNDAQFTLSTFSPRCISIQSLSLGVPLIAVATSHEPYMRLIIVPLKDSTAKGSVPIERDQILKNLSTLSPQDKYSQPIIRWKLSSNLKNNGVWVVGEDGTIRGIDLIQERVITNYQKHDGRIKSFTLAGDRLITCGTDKLVYQWV